MTEHSEQPESYAWPTETIPTMEWSDHLNDLIEFRDFLKLFGIRTENTRISRYISYLRQMAASKRFDESRIFQSVLSDSPLQSPIDWLLYILREVHEITWILKGLKIRLPMGVEDHLKAIVGGSDFAALDDDSTSRNKQFELRIASYFCQGGCEVNLGTNTDIIALTDRDAFYVECKRVSSKSQLTKRLSKARRQLRNRMPARQGGRVAVGCIAVDVTKIAFPHNGLTFGLTNEHAKNVIQRKLFGVARDAETDSMFSDCPGLVGYWFQIHISSLITHPPTPTTRFSSYHHLREGLNRKRYKTALKYLNIFHSASKDLDFRSHPSQPLTRKTRYDLPAGTEFGFDGKILMEMLTDGIAQKRDQSAKLGSLKLDEVTHEFTYYDLTLIGGDRVKDWKAELGEDLVKARLELVMQMYVQRFPFEKSE